MTAKTYEEGLAEGILVGRVEFLEKTSEERGKTCGAVMAGLKDDFTGMGQSIREGFNEAIASLKVDLKADIDDAISPLAQDVNRINLELRGNGQPGLIKRFERAVMMEKLNWGLTSAIIIALIKMGIDTWSKTQGG